MSHKKIMKIFILPDALYPHTKKQEEHSMGLYTHFLPKESAKKKKGCAIVMSHLCQIPVLHLAIQLTSKAVDLSATLAHPSIEDTFIQTHIVPGKCYLDTDSQHESSLW